MYLTFIMASIGMLVLFSVPVVGVLDYRGLTKRYTVGRRVMDAVTTAVILGVFLAYVTLIGQLYTALLGGAS